MEPIGKLPIYFVISEIVYIQPYSGFQSLRFIKQVIDCDISDIDSIYQSVMKPMYDSGQNVQTEIFLREPPSPFQSWKAVELAQREDAEERDKRDRLDYLQRTVDQDEKPGRLPGD